jgi:serine phosphatase RsbU (regulator of sigma subunit)
MNRLILALLLLLPFFGNAQNKEPEVPVYTRDSFAKPGIYYLGNNWRFTEADDPSMAQPDLDDSKWDTVTSEQIFVKNKPAFSSIGWFRFHLITDTSLTGFPLALQITHLGASEIYFDGVKIGSFGLIKGKNNTQYYDPQNIPFLLVIPKAGAHVLAVRYAYFDADKNKKLFKSEFRGFRMNFGEARYLIFSDRHQAELTATIYILLFGIFIALAISHLFLYFYYKAFKSNLYFSVFCLSLAIGFLEVYLDRLCTDPIVQHINRNVTVFVIATAAYSLSGFTNELFSKKKWRLKLVFALCLVCMCAWILDATIGAIACISLIITVLLQTIIAIVRAMYNRISGARIIGVGMLFSMLFFFAVILISFNGLHISEDTTGGKIFLLMASCAILCIPISLSLYLAWRFSYINKDLNTQLGQVQSLSDQALRQEQEKKKIVESQNEQLEREVGIRTAEIVAQKQLIEIKSKSITDNINYAQRIQSAILPDTRLVYKALEQSFILYLPKDVVSGDFYAFSQKNGKILIIAADCTGHGVSGAFMSMIGSSLLNQIINERGVEQPALILNELNRAVIEALKQGENESHDGERMQLQFAGANRPLWLLRDTEIQTYSPDKFPIGGLQMARDRVFANQTIQLQKNDTVYIFTDGYADQFGGTQGKKMMTARFKELLVGIQHLKLPEQDARLQAHFEGWKGSHEQVDDVLVIGVRV